MISTSVLLASVLMLAAGFYVMGELTFLAPYRVFILQRYGSTIACFCGLLFLNLYALIYALHRKLYLKDTGRKLAHVEKQLRTGSSISEELTARLEE